MARILLIDDNPLDRKIARDALTHSGFEVEEAADGAAGLRALYSARPDLIVLDVLMPGMDGWTACRRVRELCDVPILMLTSLNREADMVHGLDLGADDFVAKPISPGHLVARVRAILRRARPGAQTPSPLLYDDGSLRIDVAQHLVQVGDTPVELTPTEFRLLVALAGAPDRVHTYAELLSTVWGPEYVDDIDFLRVYIWRLRKKLETDPEKPRRLLTERGFGYRFATTRPSSAAPRRLP